MNNIKCLIFSLVAIILAGCASNEGFYSNRKSDQSAVLRSKFPNPLRIVGGSEVSVFFIEVDGRRLMPNMLTGDVREVFVEPGTHRITVGFKAGVAPIRIGSVAVEILIAPKGAYFFTAKPTPDSFVLEVWNEDAQQTDRQPLQTVIAPITDELRVQTY